MAETIPKRQLQQQIFGGDTTTKQSVEEDFDKLDEQKRRDHLPSAYVTVLEGIVKTVLENEYDLLSQEEINVIDNYGKLCYNARYCLARLVLRKANAWHAVSSLDNFEKQIGDHDALIRALSDLCKPISVLLGQEKVEPTIPVAVKKEPEVIDLSFDTDDDIKPNMTETDCHLQSERLSVDKTLPSTAHSHALQAVLDANPSAMNLDYFCEDETAMTMEEILQKLTNVQLQQLLKTMKCKSKSINKSDMVYALLSQASTQSVLNFKSALKSKGKKRDDGMRQTQLPFQSVKRTAKSNNQQAILKEMALKLLGKCIRVNYDFYRLVRRLHIIYYRETEHPTALLLPSLLTTFKKWNYTPYNTSRSNGIWDSRHEYLEYERALEIEKILSDIIDPPPEKSGRKRGSTPSKPRNKFATPMTPRLEGPSNTTLQTPTKAPRAASTFSQAGTPKDMTGGFLGETFLADDNDANDELVAEVKKEEKVKECLVNTLLPVWREQLVTRAAKELVEDFPNRSAALQRFETGYVYTRMVYHASKALGPLKEYQLELDIIHCLLSQQFWMRGKRGYLYVRRAIILGHLTAKASSAADKKELQLVLMEGLKEALLDQDTGIVWRPNLMKRLIAVEKRLKIAPEERSQCAAELREAKLVEIVATRRYDGLVLDVLGQPVNGKENGSIRAYATGSKGSHAEHNVPSLQERKKMGQKSRWEGKDGQVVDVETRALEHYEAQGYRGLHSETQILTTLFGLLFWDVIFADIPGAFETAFQKAPLDIFEDTFFYARKGLIDARLDEIRQGKAKEILERHDTMYREKKTLSLCVHWEFCSREDLLEIIDCMDPNSLAIVCILFCQDYKGRSSGGPDLFLWNPVTHKCKFVEVKGPGDVARENQKLWFDALLRANFDVDLCKVIDANAKVTGARKRKATPTVRRRKQNTAVTDSLNSGEEDYDQLDLESEDDVTSSRQVTSTPSKRMRL